MTDSQHAQQTRVSIDPSDNTKTVYTNAFSTKFTEHDLIVTFCVSSLEYDDKGSVLTVSSHLSPLKSNSENCSSLSSTGVAATASTPTTPSA